MRMPRCRFLGCTSALSQSLVVHLPPAYLWRGNGGQRSKPAVLHATATCSTAAVFRSTSAPLDLLSSSSLFRLPACCTQQKEELSAALARAQAEHQLRLQSLAGALSGRACNYLAACSFASRPPFQRKPKAWLHRPSLVCPLPQQPSACLSPLLTSPPPPPPNNLLGGPEHGGVFAAAAPPEHRFGLHASSKGFLAPGTGARRGHVARAMLKSGWEARAPLCALLHALYYVHVRLGCAALRSVDPAAPPPAPPPGASSGTAAELQRHSGGQQRELHTLRLHRQFRPLSIDCLQTPFSVSRATASSTTVLPVARRRSRHARRSAGETASCDAARWP